MKSIMQSAQQFFKLDWKNSVLIFLVLFLAIHSITWIFNRFNYLEEYRWILLPVLKGAEPIVLSSVIAVMLFKYWRTMKKDYPKILGVFFVGITFMFFSIEESILTDLWDRGYFAISIMIDFYNMPPIDPFQQIALFPIFLLKGMCEKGIVTLNRYLV